MNAGPLDIVLPLILEGSVVRLEPVRREHAELFWEIAKNDLEEIFRWIPYSLKTPEDFQRLIDKAFDEQERGESVVFATVGALPWQRTAVNTEAKYLMLRHAFEVGKCMRVELKTDALNQKSRNAILRIRAKEEGTLRRHLLTFSGRVLDTVYFSILDDEWAGVTLVLRLAWLSRMSRSVRVGCARQGGPRQAQGSSRDSGQYAGGT